MSKNDQETFQCLRCGKCCTWGGECRITDHEADRIAEFLGITSQEFIDKYTELTADRQGLTLTEKSPGVCIFYTTPPGCAIQEVKPEQCRGFPETWHTENWKEICAWGRKHLSDENKS